MCLDWSVSVALRIRTSMLTFWNRLWYGKDLGCFVWQTKISCFWTHCSVFQWIRALRLFFFAKSPSDLSSDGARNSRASNLDTSDEFCTAWMQQWGQTVMFIIILYIYQMGKACDTSRKFIVSFFLPTKPEKHKHSNHMFTDFCIYCFLQKWFRVFDCSIFDNLCCPPPMHFSLIKCGADITTISSAGTRWVLCIMLASVPSWPIQGQDDTVSSLNKRP